MDQGRVDRRTLLQLAGSAGAAVALAGCLSSITDTGSSDDSSRDDESGGSSGRTPESLGEESWTQYQFDRGNTGHAPDNTGPAAKPSTQWTATMGSTVETEPARANGTVYVASGDGVLYAVDEVTGTQQWTYDAGSSLRTPAVVDGTVYATTADGYVYAVDAEEGSKQWEYRVGVDIHPPTVADGTVYTGGEQGTVYALSATDGTETWVYRIGEPITAPLAATNGMLFAGTESGTGPVEPSGSLWALSSGGDLAWYDKAVNGAVVGIAVTTGSAVVGDKHGNLYGFRTKYKEDSEPLWSKELSGTGHPMPSLANGTSYVSRGQFVTAIDPADGAEQWEVAPGEMLETAPAIVGETAYAGHESGLYALDIASGSLEWGLDDGNDAMGPPAVANETIAVGSADSNLYLLAAE